MGSKLFVGLMISTVAVLLLLLAFLMGAMWGRGDSDRAPAGSTEHAVDTERHLPDPPAVKPGEEVTRQAVPNPPPPPKAVANPDRIRQNLRPGKTYVTRVKGVLNVRATDKDWGVEEVVTINYAFEANIDRDIESNDGTTVVELRHFRDVRSLKLETRLEDVRIELGPAGDALLAGIVLFRPEAAPKAGEIIKALDGASLKTVLAGLRHLNVSPEELVGLDQSAKVFAAVDWLSGKKARLTYVDGKGVVKLEPIGCELTAAQRDFLMASVLVSDSLIVPDADIKVGNRWSVDGSNFGNMVDPGLLARTSGEVVLERAPDHIVRGEATRHVKVAGGRILFEDSDPKVGRVGHFDAEGSSLYFSPRDQVIVQARLRGKAKLEKFSKDHLLFEARMRQLPELEIDYTCEVRDTLKVRP